jgi:ankyrin repeat protein
LGKIGKLLKLGADPNIADSEGRTSLHHLAHFAASADGRCLDELLDHGANANVRNRRGGTPLHDFTFRSTCTASSIEKFHLKAPTLTLKMVAAGTPLSWAVRNSNIEVIDKLVEHRVDLEIQSNLGWDFQVFA